jgi:hypothetical protein
MVAGCQSAATALVLVAASAAAADISCVENRLQNRFVSRCALCFAFCPPACAPAHLRTRLSFLRTRARLSTRPPTRGVRQKPTRVSPGTTRGRRFDLHQRPPVCAPASARGRGRTSCGRVCRRRGRRGPGGRRETRGPRQRAGVGETGQAGVGEMCEIDGVREMGERRSRRVGNAGVREMAVWEMTVWERCVPPHRVQLASYRARRASGCLRRRDVDGGAVACL